MAEITCVLRDGTEVRAEGPNDHRTGNQLMAFRFSDGLYEVMFKRYSNGDKYGEISSRKLGVEPTNGQP